MAQKAVTGKSNTNAAASFTAVPVSINPYNGDPSQPIQPDTQYYARVRAKLSELPDVFTEWSEPAMCSTEPLPNPNGMVEQDGKLVDMAPLAGFTASVAGTTITLTDASAVNPISGAALHNLRYSTGPTKWSVTVAPGNTATLEAPGSGTFRVFQTVADVTGKIGVYALDVVVP